MRIIFFSQFDASTKNVAWSVRKEIQILQRLLGYFFPILDTEIP
jgi:hypothetical protein